MVEQNRIAVLKDMPPREGGAYVLYWMQQAQRAEGNAALDHAVEIANEFGLPVAVCFGLTGRTGAPYPDANARHYVFMLEGLAEVERTLGRRGIAFVPRFGAPDEVALALAERAAVLVCDRGYLKPQRAWQEAVVARSSCRVVRVETDVVVPVESASTKHEFAARTLRPKLQRLWEPYLVESREPALRTKAAGLHLEGDVDLSDPRRLAATLRIDQSVGPVRRFSGGLATARKRLRGFLERSYPGYREARNAPEASHVSHLSPSLHFGHISPGVAALAGGGARAEPVDRDSFLDELIVRRELSMNHCFHEPRYDSYAGLPAWSREALDRHRGDKRPYLYDRAQLEAGETHDRYWNGAMREMRETGYMHNRLRMYWGKKIVEWSPSPEEAFDTTLAINNKFFVDGRDANSFTNVGWLFGLHDRPWFRRPVFGTVRYMGDNTLRKFDAEGYLRSVDALVAAEG